MWPYNDDENLWLKQPAPDTRNIPQDEVSPELTAFHESRGRQLRADAALKGSVSAFRGKGASIPQRWIGAWLRRPRSVR